jgi:chromosome partitioning protein
MYGGCMLLVVGGIKGGSGKTTIATNLCQMRAASGKKVLLVDADDQQSSYQWSLHRDETGLGHTTLEHGFVTICLSGKSIYSNLLKMRGDYDDIIVDTGGRDTTSQRSALCDADKFLIPFKPRSIDIWTIGSVSRIITECMNKNLKSFVVINQADPKGKDNEDALGVLKECQEVECLPMFIGNRKSFGNAAAEGLGVHELFPKDEKACKEIKDLYDAIYS